MGANGRNSGEAERKLEGGDAEKQTQQAPTTSAAPAASGDGGLHPAVYIAYGLIQEPVWKCVY
jgi:hypothetical protein